MLHRKARQPGARSQWKRVRAATLLLLAIWFAVTFLSIWFARELSGLTLFGWSVSFYMAAQGAILIYLALIGGYALWMDHLEAPAQAGSDDGQ